MKKKFFKYILTVQIFVFELSAMDRSIETYNVDQLDNSLAVLNTGQTLRVLGEGLTAIVTQNRTNYLAALEAFKNALTTSNNAATIEMAIQDMRTSLLQTRSTIQKSDIVVAHGAIPADMPPMQLSGSVANQGRQRQEYDINLVAHQQTLNSYKTQIFQAYQEQQNLLINEQEELYRNTLDAVNGILNLAQILHARNQTAIQTEILRRIQDKCSGRLSGVRGESILALRTGNIDGQHITMHDAYTILQEVRQDMEDEVRKHARRQEQTITDLNTELTALRNAAANGAYSASNILEPVNRHIDISSDWTQLMSTLSGLSEIATALNIDGVSQQLLLSRIARIKGLHPSDFSRLVLLNEAAELKIAQIRELEEAFSVGDPDYRFDGIAQNKPLLDVSAMVDSIITECQHKEFVITATESLEQDLTALNHHLMRIINSDNIHSLAMHVIYSLGGYIGFGKELGPKMLKELGIAAAGCTRDDQIRSFQDNFAEKFNGKLESLNAEPFMFNEERGKYLSYSIQEAIMLHTVKNVISYFFKSLISCSLDAIHPDLTAFQMASEKYSKAKAALDNDPDNGHNKDISKSRNLIGRNFDQANETLDNLKNRLKTLNGISSRNIFFYKEAILNAFKQHVKCKDILDFVNHNVRAHFASDTFWKPPHKNAAMCQIAFLPLQEFEFVDREFDFAKYKLAIPDIAKTDQDDENTIVSVALKRFTTIKEVMKRTPNVTIEHLSEYVEHHAHMDELLLKISDGFRKSKLKNLQKAAERAGTERNVTTVFSISETQFTEILNKYETNSQRHLQSIVNEVSNALPPPAPRPPPPTPRNKN